MDRLTLDDINAAVEAPVPTAEVELIPGRPPALVRGIASFAEYEAMSQEAEARMGVSGDLAPKDAAGKPIRVTERMVHLALLLQHGVVEPAMNFADALKICNRYAQGAIAVKNKIDELSAAGMETALEAAKTDIQETPFPGVDTGAGVEDEPPAD
jgi:hypothetical protein